jgi:hypothetical protein
MKIINKSRIDILLASSFVIYSILRYAIIRSHFSLSENTASLKKTAAFNTQTDK